MGADTQVTVTDNPGEQRFEIRLGGTVVGRAHYRPEGDALAFTHTEIDDGHDGEGLGSQLVRGALEQVRARGASVLPYCPFVASYLKKQPELQDIVPAAQRERFDLS